MKKLISLSLSAFLLSQTVVSANYIYFKGGEVSKISTRLDRSIAYDEVLILDKENRMTSPFSTARCGIGLLGRSDRYNEDTCNSSLTSMDIEFIDFIIYPLATLFSFGLFPIINGTMHNEYFKFEKINTYVNDSDFHTFKNYLNFSHEIDVVDKFDIDDYTSNSTLLLTNDWQWDNSYDILIKKSNDANTLYINRSKSMTETHDKWLNAYAANTPSPEIINVPMVSRPVAPNYARPSLVISPKTEFESKAQYDERSKKAMSEYEEAVVKAKEAYYKAVRIMKENYADDVSERNKKAKKEMEKYVEAVQDTNKERAKLKSKLSEVSENYKKTILLFTLSKPQISNPIYDAESQYLKVDFYDVIAKANKALPIKMSVSDAKELKNNLATAKVKAQYALENDVLSLKKLSINGDDYTPLASDKLSHKIDFSYDFSKNNEIVITQDELNRIFPMQDTAYGEIADDSADPKVVDVAPKSAALPSFRK